MYISYMTYVAYFYGAPVFNAWLGVPDMAYGINVHGSVVNPVKLPIPSWIYPGYKVFAARFPVEVVAVFFYACPEGYCTEPIYVELDVPSDIVYVTLIGVKP